MTTRAVALPAPSLEGFRRLTKTVVEPTFPIEVRTRSVWLRFLRGYEDLAKGYKNDISKWCLAIVPIPFFLCRALLRTIALLLGILIYLAVKKGYTLSPEERRDEAIDKLLEAHGGKSPEQISSLAVQFSKEMGDAFGLYSEKAQDILANKVKGFLNKSNYPTAMKEHLIKKAVAAFVQEATPAALLESRMDILIDRCNRAPAGMGMDKEAMIRPWIEAFVSENRFQLGTSDSLATPAARTCLVEMMARSLCKARDKKAALLKAIASFKEASEQVKEGFETGFLSGLPPCCDTPQNRQFLRAKLAAVSFEDEHSLKARRTILFNIALNFATYLKEAVERVDADIKGNAAFRHALGIGREDRIEGIQVLGNTTYNGGKIPLLITLRSPDGTVKKFVYKPRSMITEEILCKEGTGAFARAGLRGVYKIYNAGAYGYGEWLENRREENTFATREALYDYLSEFAMMDAIAASLCIGDLHGHNVVASRGRPCLIDTEAVTPEESFHTPGLIDNLTGGYFPMANGKNRIWIEHLRAPRTQALLDSDDFDPMELCVAIREELSIDPAFFGSAQARQAEHLRSRAEELDAARTELGRHEHRIILAPTDMLWPCLCGNASAFEDFLRQMKSGLKGLKFSDLSSAHLAIIKKQFEKDVENNDIPVFYYKPETGEVRYGPVIIGRKLS